ncbi:hypothetical protein Syun_029767 [Stephania yunnanensis]|uniref:Uncharacterized protein n=1 Tax=Stephania yunnanensis TaxID=152371 RepID=A0AAP0HGB8_9MAGN
MVRAPCCEKMGLKKGPWTPEEDQILIGYIQHFGHGNWRALPKQAVNLISYLPSGLLRCGKSCRLRWTNYLRPDIKRGNFSNEEEEAIIKLHELLGNRWSAIAARLPGRTDNEIKNVWHTHLKKRLKANVVKMTNDGTQEDLIEISQINSNNVTTRGQEEHMNIQEPHIEAYSSIITVSPQNSSEFDFSSATTDSSVLTGGKEEYTDSSPVTLPEFDEGIWSEELRRENLVANSVIWGFDFDQSVKLSVDDNNMDFWFNLLLKAENIPTLELPEF